MCIHGHIGPSVNLSIIISRFRLTRDLNLDTMMDRFTDGLYDSVP